MTLLAVAGVLGALLAVHGYRAPAVAPSSAAGPVQHVGGPTASAGAGAHGGQRGPARGSRSQARPTTTTSTAPATGKTSQKLGPPLSSTSYASYAYELYPGPVSSQAAAATAGFSVKVKPGSGSFSVTVSAVGTSGPPQTSTYPSGDRVYFVEATLGDDSNNVDYNFGDDGVVITDAHGRLVQ
jgi:hypothetical protein